MMNIGVGTYPGVIEASMERDIPVGLPRDSEFPDISIINQRFPGIDVRQRHQVVDIFNCVLETADGELNVGGSTVWRMTYRIGPQSVAIVISEGAIELSVL